MHIYANNPSSICSMLYYTDWGSQAAVVRTSLDGTSPEVIQTGLDNPNSVYVMQDKVYVVDSHYKTRKAANLAYPGDSRNGSLYTFAGASFDVSELNALGSKALVVRMTTLSDINNLILCNIYINT